MKTPKPAIDIAVETRYIAEHSAPEENRYVFAYTITLRNRGHIGAKLLNRYWRITDANGKVQEIHGKGVVGQQPHLQPGEEYHYTSGSIIETPVGAMQGEYEMIDDNGERFIAPIAPFSLQIPNSVH